MIPQAVDNKIAQIVTACVYKIATGAWPTGGKLPSLRAGAESWGVDPLTVKRAYDRLKKRGLVRVVPKSGVFVRDNAPVASLRRHRPTLEALYGELENTIRARTELSVLGVFRYLARLAAENAAKAPECAFVECTEFQATQQAIEVTKLLAIPCLPIVLGDLVEGRRVLEPSVRSVVTTGFHHAAVAEVCASADVQTVQVAAPFSAAKARAIAEAGPRAALLGLDANQGRLIADEIVRKGGRPELDIAVSAVDPSEAVSIFEAQRQCDEKRPDGITIITSPTIWEALPETLRSAPAVFTYAFEFDKDAVVTIARAIGLPIEDPVTQSEG